LQVQNQLDQLPRQEMLLRLMQNLLPQSLSWLHLLQMLTLN
jgi:hypothetical protein